MEPDCDRRGALRWQLGTGGDRSSGWSTSWPGEWHEVKFPNQSELRWHQRLLHRGVILPSSKDETSWHPG